MKNGGSDDDTIITYLGNRIFSFLGQYLFSLEINDILYTYLMGKTKSFNNLNIKSNDFRFLAMVFISCLCGRRDEV